LHHYARRGAGPLLARGAPLGNVRISAEKHQGRTRAHVFCPRSPPVPMVGFASLSARLNPPCKYSTALLIPIPPNHLTPAAVDLGAKLRRQVVLVRFVAFGLVDIL